MSLSPLSEENTCSCSLASQLSWLQDFLESIEHPRDVRPLIIVGGKWPQNVTWGVWSHVLGEGRGDRMWLWEEDVLPDGGLKQRK